MKKVFCLLFFLPLLVITKANAQNYYNGDDGLHQKALRLNLGTQGLGAEFSYGLSSVTHLRVGANWMPVKASNVFGISGFNSSSNLSATFSNVHLLADFTPIKSAPNFRVVGGAAYFMRANGGLEVIPSDKYTYGDIAISPEEVGKMNMNVSWRGIAPYLGIGLLRPLPGQRFNINFDVGAYYLTRPTAEVTAYGLLRGNTSQQAQLQKNADTYRFLPVVQINFNFKL